MRNLVNLNEKSWQYVVLMLLSLIWGTSFILMKRGLEAFTSLQLAAMRVSIAFIVLSPIAIKHFRLINKQNYKSLLIAGYLGIGFPALLFSTAQQHISSSLAGVLNSLTPVFTLVFGMGLYKTKFRMNNLIGVVIGFIGASFLILTSTGFSIGTVNYYALLVMVATAFYGINSNEIKNNLGELSGIQVTSLAFLVVAPVAFAYLLFSDFSQALGNPVFGRSLLSIVVLAVFGSAIAVMLYNYFIKFTSAVFASSVTYIIPVFAIIWGLSDGESLGLPEVISVLVILFGVWLVNKNGHTNQH